MEKLVNMTIYVDLDGVLADYDSRANEVLNTDNHYKYEFIWGKEVYWHRVSASNNFFGKLSPMSDASLLWSTVRKVAPYKPVILTALPSTDSEAVDRQKRRWVKDHIQHDAEVITCQTHEKPNYCKPGDILIDDRAINRDAWLAKGGTYIIHTTAERTIGALQALGVIV
jgi:hypothetical protein